MSLLLALTFYAYPAAAFGASVGTTPTDTNPAIVHVGIVVRNLVAIDEVKENWQVTGLLVAKWVDPKLKYRQHGRGQFNRDLSAIWKPSFEFLNEVKPTDFRLTDLYAQPDGTVVYTQSFNATLSSALDLRRFPFDSQVLPAVVEARGDDLDRTILRSDPADSSLRRRAYLGLAQWIPVSLTAQLSAISGSVSNANDVEFGLKVQRNPKSYIYKFIVPLLLLVIISWVTFWLSHEEFKTKDQLTSAVSTLLIIVAFNITASTLIPRTDYITYIDALLFTCFVFVVISIATIVGIHLVQMHHSARGALVARRIAGVALPIAFLITQGILFFGFHVAG